MSDLSPTVNAVLSSLYRQISELRHVLDDLHSENPGADDAALAENLDVEIEHIRYLRAMLELLQRFPLEEQWLTQEFVQEMEAARR